MQPALEMPLKSAVQLLTVQWYVLGEESGYRLKLVKLLIPSQPSPSH